MSLLIATAILATGGVGLYMYKSSENEPIEDRESEETEREKKEKELT